jgi:hypothetical protein
VTSARAAGQQSRRDRREDLIAGSGIAFRERGTAELKGVPGEWRLSSAE